MSQGPEKMWRSGARGQRVITVWGCGPEGDLKWEKKDEELRLKDSGSPKPPSWLCVTWALHGPGSHETP